MVIDQTSPSTKKVIERSSRLVGGFVELGVWDGDDGEDEGERVYLESIDPRVWEEILVWMGMGLRVAKNRLLFL